MPWKIEERGSEFVVVKEGTGKVVGRHKSKSDAERHLKALYANVPEAKRKEVIYRLVEVAAKESIPAKYLWAAYTLGAASTSKSVNEIVREFRDRLIRSSVDTMSGHYTAEDLAVEHRRLLRDVYQRAYVEGMIEGGATASSELSVQDEQAIQGWLSNQLSYVKGYAESVAKYPSLPVDQRDPFRKSIYERIDLWSQSVYSLGMMGFASIRKDRLGEWVLGSTREHCATCRTLNGKVHRLSWYVSRNYLPRMPGSGLECGGYKCQCTVVDPRTGAVLL